MRRLKVFFGKTVKLLGCVLDDLLAVGGCACLVAAAWLRWGTAAGLAALGAGLLAFSILVARSGKG